MSLLSLLIRYGNNKAQERRICRMTAMQSLPGFYPAVYQRKLVASLGPGIDSALYI